MKSKTKTSHRDSRAGFTALSGKWFAGILLAMGFFAISLPASAQFTDPLQTRDALMASWDAGWACVFGALEPLGEDDLAKTVMIRGEAHSVMQAINRQVAHYPYHCGQIVFLAKHLNHDGWKSLTVPRGKSEEFNQRVRAGEASQR